MHWYMQLFAFVMESADKTPLLLSVGNMTVKYTKLFAHAGTLMLPICDSKTSGLGCHIWLWTCMGGCKFAQQR